MGQNEYDYVGGRRSWCSNCAIYFSETEKIIKNKFHLVDLSVA